MGIQYRDIDKDAPFFPFVLFFLGGLGFGLLGFGGIGNFCGFGLLL